MRNPLVPSLSLFAALVLTVLPFAAYAHDAKFVCKKDGAHLKATGHDDAEQKADCEKQGGTWEKHQHDAKKDGGHDEKKAGGGGW